MLGLSNTIVVYYTFLGQLTISELILHYFLIAVAVNLIEQIINSRIDTLNLNLNSKILLSLVLIYSFGMVGNFIVFIPELLNYTYQINFLGRLVYSIAFLVPGILILNMVYKEILNFLAKKNVLRAANRQLLRIGENTERVKVINQEFIQNHVHDLIKEQNDMYLTFIVKIAVSVILTLSLFAENILMGFVGMFMSVFYLKAPLSVIMDLFKNFEADERGEYLI